MALLGLLYVGSTIRRTGVTAAVLAAAACLSVPLVTLNQQLITGYAIMPQNWEFSGNYICLVVAAGLLASRTLSSWETGTDWKRFGPLALWAGIAFLVVRGELRNEAHYTADNARSVLFGRVFAEARDKLGRIDAVVLPHLWDESLFLTRVPPGTQVLGGYNWLIRHSPPVWPTEASFAQHAQSASASFAIGFETLFRRGVTPEQLEQSMQAEFQAGNCWPTSMYFFSLNDCWPAFLNYSSPASRRLPMAIAPLVEMYRAYLQEKAALAAAGRRVLLITLEPAAGGVAATLANELVVDMTVDVGGRPMRAFGYVQRLNGS